MLIFYASLGGAITVLAIFSISVQASAGSTFGLVSYLDAVVPGSVVGLVGAGGNLGGAFFAYLQVRYDYKTSFVWSGITAVSSAVLTAFIAIPGHRSLLTGHDSAEILQHRRHAKLPAVIIIGGGDDDTSEQCKDNESSHGDSVDAL